MSPLAYRHSVVHRANSSNDDAFGLHTLLTGARVRICARLQRAFEFPIAMLSAPAGYHQRSVVCDALRSSGRAYRYIDVDTLDGNVLGFLHALVRALGDEAPALASSFVAVYDRVADAPDAADQLARWLAENLEPLETTLVVDGLDAVTDFRVADLLAALVDRTATGVRWILIVERSERLPIARWLAQGRLDLPIDADDLALTEHDLRRHRRRSASALRNERMRKLCAATRGWPAAVALGVVAGGSVNLDAAPSDRAACYAYFAEAMLTTLSEQDEAFIDVTCLFRAFDASLLECAGLFDTSETLARLLGAGVLCVNASGTYQYDGLFAAHVAARLRARPDDEFKRVTTATADAYLRDGCHADAITVYVKLDDFAAVGLLLSTHGFELMDRGESNTVARALRAIPHDVLAEFPGALAVKACYESLHGKFDVAEAWFRLALSRLEDGVERNEIVYRFGLDLVRRERFDVIELLLPVVCGIKPDTPLAAPLLALLATAYALNAQFAEATVMMDRALVLLPRIVEPNIHAKVLHQAGFVALYLRDIARAKSFCGQAYAEACACYSFDIAARALSVLYNIALDYEHDVGVARAHLVQLAELSARAGSRQLLLYATLCRYEIEVLSGNVPQIERLNEQLASLEVFFSVLTTETLLPAQALQAAWDGEFYRAYRLLAPSAEHQIDPDRRAYRYAEIGLYAAAAGLRDEALAAAETALTIARSTHSIERTARHTLAYVALTFVLTRRRARAAKLLGQLSLQSSTTDRIEFFVQVVRTLAARWTSHTVDVDLAAQLDELERRDLGGLARMVEALPLPETARGRMVQLTSAERAILVRLSTGMSPRQIALSSGRGTQRIGAQIASLCRKLGCSEQRHAVAVAVNEGLLYEATGDPAKPVGGQASGMLR